MPSSQEITRCLTVLFVLFAEGCGPIESVFHPTAESGFRVRANIVEVGTTASCTLELYEPNDSKPWQSRRVGLKFQQTFIIAPGLHRYYMVIDCGVPWKPHRTQVYELGGTRHFSTPLDLGTIHFQKK